MAETLVDYRRQLSFLHNVIDACPLPMILTDTAGKLTDANPAFCKMVGGTREDFQGDGWANYVVPERLAEIAKVWQDGVDRHLNIVSGIVVYKSRPDVMCHYKMVRIEDNGYCGFIVPETCACAEWT